MLFLFSPTVRIIISILFLSLASCTPDVLVPCDGDGPSGKLCREYRYYEGSAQGYVEFEYEGDSVTSTFYDRGNNLKKTVIERFSEERIASVTNQFPDAPSVVGTYHYNELDSLFLIVYGANDSSVNISYVDGKRFTEHRVAGTDTISTKEFRYFQDNGVLYRISEYDENQYLITYRNFDYFTTGGIEQYRTTEYTSDHDLIGRKVYTFTQLGLISSMEYRLTDGTIAESMDYIYDSAGKLTEQSGQRFGNGSKSVYLYY